jgi:hypothetical protein
MSCGLTTSDHADDRTQIGSVAGASAVRTLEGDDHAWCPLVGRASFCTSRAWGADGGGAQDHQMPHTDRWAGMARCAACPAQAGLRHGWTDCLEAAFLPLAGHLDSAVRRDRPRPRCGHFVTGVIDAVGGVLPGALLLAFSLWGSTRGADSDATRTPTSWRQPDPRGSGWTLCHAPLAILD